MRSVRICISFAVSPVNSLKTDSMSLSFPVFPSDVDTNFICVTFMLSFNFPSGGDSVYLHWWAALNQGAILLAGTSLDGPLIGQPWK